MYINMYIYTYKYTYIYIYILNPRSSLQGVGGTYGPCEPNSSLVPSKTLYWRFECAWWQLNASKTMYCRLDITFVSTKLV